MGFTLVELLVVIFIIGLLVALLLPAVQAAREAGRRAQCKSHLRQLALAALTHHEQVGHFPTGGWNNWIGDADRGFGQEQPGSWAYNILPFLEETAAHDLPRDGKPEVITPEQLDGALQLVQTPFEVFHCPSRRTAKLYPGNDSLDHSPPRNGPPLQAVAKIDYAGNQGDKNGPSGREPGRMSEWYTTYSHTRLGFPKGGFYAPTNHVWIGLSPLTGADGYNGIIFAVSEVSLHHVTDGASNTHLIGEKHLDPVHYETGGFGDWTTLSAGSSHDTLRESYKHPVRDVHFGPNTSASSSFGSPHAAGAHMAFCDGSVRVVNYDIDWFVYMAGGNRHDGTAHGVGLSTTDPFP